MRRINVTITFCLVCILVVLHGLGIELAGSRLKTEGLLKQDTSQNICGRVVGMQQRQAGGYRLEVALTSVDGRAMKGKEKILVTYPYDMEEPWRLFNQTISFTGTLSLPQTRRNPGCFDYRLYLKSRGIFYTASTKVYQVTDTSQSIGEKVETWLIHQRYRFEEILDPASVGLVTGVLFGDTSSMEEETYEEFRKNGTAHILAVSGLHIGILYAVYRKLVGKRRNLPALLLLWGLMWSYGTISMWSPSVSRAVMMIGLKSAGQVLDLRYDRLTGLSTVALVLLLKNPYALFGTGFQMSFLAMISIDFLKPLIPAKVPEGVALALAVNLGLLPYQMYCFNYISFVSLVINFPIIYLAGILVPAALGAFVLFLLAGTMGPMGLLLDSLSLLLTKINHLSTLGGYGSMEVASPPLWIVIGFYLLALFLSSEWYLVRRLRQQKRGARLGVAICIIASVAVSGLYVSPLSRDQIIFVDVGQGDCIHIRDGGKNVLIDGGGSVSYNTGKNTLKPYLLKNGARKVDMAMATHLHADHYRGLTELAQVYPVLSLKTGLTYGTRVEISEKVFIETLWPVTIDEEEGQDENHRCSVFMIHYNGWKILVTGDLDEEGEREMLSFYESFGRSDALKADILKVGHHGSKTSSSDAFLDAVSPQVAVIQVGVYNIYGHPSEKIVDKFTKRGIMVKRNDSDGAVGIGFQGNAGETEGGFVVHTVLEGEQDSQ